MVETKPQGYWQCDQTVLPGGQTVSGHSSWEQKSRNVMRQCRALFAQHKARYPILFQPDHFPNSYSLYSKLHLFILEISHCFRLWL